MSNTPYGKMSRRNMFIPDVQWGALVKLSKKRGFSVTELIRQAIAQYLSAK